MSRKETTYSVAKPAPEYTPEQIRASFYARQSTYAYQSMFVCILFLTPSLLEQLSLLNIDTTEYASYCSIQKGYHRDVRYVTSNRA